jgi:Coenzyme PQQ synthesis protein D (PqqD)
MNTYSRNQQIIDGTIDDNQIMMHIERGKYFGLTSVGKRIWELLETPRNQEEIVQALISEYDVTENQCQQEVQRFLEKAVSNDIITLHASTF